MIELTSKTSQDEKWLADTQYSCHSWCIVYV